MNATKPTSLQPRFKSLMVALAVLAASLTTVGAEEYIIDSKGKHAFIQFKVSHLGYSFVIGEFPDFTGNFSYDEANPSAASITVDIDTTTADTRHAERNKHIRGKDFLDVRKYPDAKFVSTGYQVTSDSSGILNGNLTLRGQTVPIMIDITKVGSGKDPWGGVRLGFEGETSITMADFGINYNLGPTARTVDLYLVVEGILQQ